MCQIDPDVVCAYPITPQTEVVQLYAQMVADGRVASEFVTVESEHSAMSAVIGSAAGGARTMTATSSQGFALMWEVLFIAASYRLPIVMTTVNRALAGPINIHCDHSDTMGGRDTGWIQLYGENHQEAYDNCIQSVRIAESMDVRLPTMHMYDGYVISGAIGPLQMLTKDEVQQFIGPYRSTNPMLDTKNPVTVGPFDGLHGWYFEHKVAQNRAMDRALKVNPGHRRRVRRAQRPPVWPARPVPPRRRRGRHRRGRLHRRHHAHDRGQAARQRRQGRHGARARLPAVPARGLRAGAAARQGRGRHGPRRLVRRPGRPRLSRDPRGALRLRPAPAGAAVHLRPRRPRHLPGQHRAGLRPARGRREEQEARLDRAPLPQPARRLRGRTWREAAHETAARTRRSLRAPPSTKSSRASTSSAASWWTRAGAWASSTSSRSGTAATAAIPAPCASAPARWTASRSTTAPSSKSSRSTSRPNGPWRWRLCRARAADPARPA